MKVNEALHAISQGLEVPAMAILLALLVAVAVCVGSLIVEAVMERRHFKVDVEEGVRAIHGSSIEGLPAVIEAMPLLRGQKEALLAAARNAALPDEDLFAIAKAELARVDDRCRASVRVTDLITKIGPMMGLICTLIPLGPGIVAMGQGDVAQLSESLLVAFDGTVAGLVSAVVAMCVSTVRKRWYAGYGVAMEALMGALLERAEAARCVGGRP